MECFLCHKEKEMSEYPDKCNICEPCRLIIDEQRLMPVGMQNGKLLVSEKQAAMGSSYDLLKHITEFSTLKFVVNEPDRRHRKKNNREQPWRIKERERREKLCTPK